MVEITSKCKCNIYINLLSVTIHKPQGFSQGLYPPTPGVSKIASTLLSRPCKVTLETQATIRELSGSVAGLRDVVSHRIPVLYKHVCLPTFA